MASASDLLGMVITGATNVFTARETAKVDQNAIEAQRAAVREAQARTTAAQSAYQTAQDFFNSNMAKTANFLMATVALTLVGVIGYNVIKR